MVTVRRRELGDVLGGVESPVMGEEQGEGPGKMTVIRSYSRCVFILPHSFTYCLVSALLLVAGWVQSAQILEEK